MFFSKDKISIIGAGWLGLALANYLNEQNYDIQIVKKSKPVPTLEKFWLKKDIDTDNLFELSEAKVWIYMLPPVSTEKILSRLEKILSLKLPEKIILISSTGIYPDENKIWKETDLPAGGFEKTALELTEKIWFDTGICSILRCSGLVGPGRNPAKFLAAKKNIPKPNAPVNLVHQWDVIQAISTLIKNENLSEVYNLAAPFHPSRIDFYSKMAEKYQLEKPEFLSDLTLGKEIFGQKIVDKTCFKYKITDFYQENLY